jgi:hypothetical protein
MNFDVTVFSDPQGEAAARIYVVAVPTDDVSRDELASFRLSGHIVGPTSRYASTLPAKVPFTHRGLTRVGDRTALLAEATLPDPCYWSTETPFLYRAVGEIQSGVGGPIEFDQTFGTRSLAVVGRRLALNGVPWVPRIVHRVEVAGDPPLGAWRESATVLYVDHADDDLCREASAAGVWLMATVEGDGRTVTDELFRLGRYPAVAIVIVKSAEVNDRELRTTAQNTLLARFSDRKFDAAVADGTDVLVTMSLADGSAWGLQWAEKTALPMIVMRPIDRVVPLPEARAACDALQRDLAGKHDAAGFWV